MRRARGFTLIEVMAALAILAMGLAILLRATANNVRKAEATRMMSVATQLARGKMYDIEEALRKDGFQQMSEVGLPENEGDFEEEGWPQITWKVEIREVELPSPEQLATMAQQEAEKAAKEAEAAGAGSGSGSGIGSGSASTGESSGLFGMLSMFGGGASADPTEAANTAGFMGAGGFNIVQEVFKQALRKVVLTVTWRSIGVEDSLTVVEYITDPDAMNRVIGGVGGATNDDYAGEQRP